MSLLRPPITVRAVCPGKAILLGEHSVSRGQAAIAGCIGLYTTCQIVPDRSGRFRFQAGDQQTELSRDEVITLQKQVNTLRRGEDYEGLKELAGKNFFAASCYVVGEACGADLPVGMHISFQSEIPVSAGLGSGAAAFVALARALGQLLGGVSEETVGDWAHLGEVVAHGGIASRLDTETCLRGGIIRVSAAEGSVALPYHKDFRLVLGHSGVFAPTNPVKARVREWLAVGSHRMHVFEEIGLLSRLAEPALRDGDWKTLGQLMNLNQLLLREIGVSCAEVERLAEVAQAAGAYGAKLTGSGGGGFVIALVDPDRLAGVVSAMRSTGAATFAPEVGVRGTGLA